MIFIPVASQFLGPVQAITTMAVMELFSPLPLVPAAIRAAAKRELAIMTIGLIFFVPAGFWVLGHVSPDGFGWMASLFVLLIVSFLILGCRYQGALPTPAIFGTGALSGFAGGLLGMAGPPVILIYMASTNPVAVIRANLLLFLLNTDVVLITTIFLAGALTPETVVLGLLLAIPGAMGGLFGGFVFRPELEILYRRVAYGIIIIAALSGLPILD